MPLIKNYSFLIPPLFLGFAVAALITFAAPSLVFSAPTITWTPSQVTGEIARGEQKTTVVSFTSSQKFDEVTVWIAPQLQPYVRTTPSSFSSISKGTKYTVTLTLSASVDASLQNVEGTIQLRQKKKPNKLYEKPLPVSLTITAVPLPPDPGEAGKATLEGIDSDNDGVRDDIQRYIALTYPDSEKTRAALIQVAKAEQHMVLSAGSEEEATTATLEGIRAIDCLSYVRGVDEGAEIWSELRARILNTDMRSRAYLQAVGRVKGFTLPSKPIEQRKLLCDFDPDSMEN